MISRSVTYAVRRQIRELQPFSINKLNSTDTSYVTFLKCDVDFTNLDTLFVAWYSQVETTIKCSIDGVSKFETTGAADTQQEIVDVSGITGVKELKFEIKDIGTRRGISDFSYWLVGS